MFNFDGGFFTFAILAIIASFLRIVLLNRQMQGMNRRVIDNRKAYPHVGLGYGKRKMTRCWLLVSADEMGNIMHAELMKGWSMFAKLKPYEAINGCNMHEIADEVAIMPSDVDGRTSQAATMACKQILQRLQDQTEEQSLLEEVNSND
ncbi:transcriptional regulator GutM [Eubacteriales bacterium OttesenSCG-928-N14]|nr:transcriptional regulator GutM [Eubacteriales bacterium OttesenSCG-928-N14]